MSADYWLVLDGGGPEPVEVASFNITYNLGPMLRAAGFPAWDALKGAPASEVGGMLRSVAEELRSDPEKYRAYYNPPNGWGDFEVRYWWFGRQVVAADAWVWVIRP